MKLPVRSLQRDPVVGGRADRAPRREGRLALARNRERRSAYADRRLCPGYAADHWCDRGHVLFALDGELDVELRDGREYALQAGMSFNVSDHGDAAHRVSTKTGSRVFIVD
jgi:hypothetical protein